MSEMFWWHWIIFGCLLIGIELIIPHLVIIWFGLSAILVGGVDYIFTLSIELKFALWILFGVLFLLLWLKVFKSTDIESVGQSNQGLGLEGKSLEDINPTNRGRVEFRKPLYGSIEWIAISNENIKKGDRVIVTKVIGNLVEIKKSK